MSEVRDNSTVAVDINGDQAQGLIFRPGDTLIVRLNESASEYSEEMLTDIVQTLREAMGDTVEVVLVDSGLTIHKGVMLHASEEGHE